MKLVLLGVFISVVFLIFVVLLHLYREKKEKNENKIKQEVLKRVNDEKKEEIKKITTGNNKFDFDASIDILHNYSSRRK